MLRRVDIVTSSRLAGLVKRWHTWPMLREQTNAEHTWQVMRLHWEIFGPMSPEVSTAILWHDGGEMQGGDVPFPTKARNPDLKAGHDRVEQETIAAMLTPVQAAQLRTQLDLVDQTARWRIKVCDLLEMWEHGGLEMAMGNTLAAPIVHDTEAALEAMLAMLEDPGDDIGMDTTPPTDADRVRTYMHRAEKRMHHD